MMTTHIDSVRADDALIQPEPYKIRARLLDVLKDVKHEAWKTGRDGSCEESFGEARAQARFDAVLDELVVLALGGAA